MDDREVNIEEKGRFKVVPADNNDVPPVTLDNHSIFGDTLSFPGEHGSIDEDAESFYSAKTHHSLNSATQQYFANNMSNDVGSMFGSQLLLASQAYLNIYQTSIDQGLNTIDEDAEDPGNLYDNPEYIDTLEGRLPLAQAARMIAQDATHHEKLFDKKCIRKTQVDSYRRICIIALGMHCLFASFFSVRNAQSSLVPDPQIALTAYGCSFALMWLGGLCTNPLVARLKPKWTMALASSMFIFFPLANYYPMVFTLVPTALGIGFGWGLLWSSEGVYLMNIASAYALVSKKPLKEVVSRFNSIVFSAFLGSAIIGNLISSLVLGDIYILPGESQFVNDYYALSTYTNKTLKLGHSAYPGPDVINSSFLNEINSTAINSETISYCGLEFFEKFQTTSSKPVYLTKKYIFYGVTTFLAVIGFLCFAALLKKLTVARPAGSGNILVALKGMLKILADVKALLILPMIFYMGIIASIILADQPKAFISCQYGVGYIGYVIMTGFIFSVISAFASGILVPLLGRLPIILTSATISFSSLVLLLLWDPQPGSITVIAFLPTCLWCFADGFIFTTINGMLAELFKKKIAYALTFQSTIFSLSALFGTFSTAFGVMTLTAKIICAMAANIFAVICYITLELVIKYKKI